MSCSSSWNPFISSSVILSTPRSKAIIKSPSLLITNSNSNPKFESNSNNCKLTANPPPLERLPSLLFQCGVLFTSVESHAALAVTGENGGDDLVTTIVSGGIVAVLYLFIIPPILMNWMRLRWYKRKFLETYLQFMCAFIFFPGSYPILHRTLLVVFSSKTSVGVYPLEEEEDRSIRRAVA